MLPLNRAHFNLNFIKYIYFHKIDIFMIICSPKNIICLSIWPNLILHFLHIGPMPFLIKCFLSIFGFVLVWMEFSYFLFWIITAIQRYSYTFPNYARTEMNQRNAKYITKGQKNEESKEVACNFFFRVMFHFFFLFLKIKFIYFSWRLITLQYCSGFCHTLIWISHGGSM